jgi:hypothetical protein
MLGKPMARGEKGKTRCCALLLLLAGVLTEMPTQRHRGTEKKRKKVRESAFM